jgi:signal transduction histidine kinase
VLLSDPPQLQAITDTARRLGASSGPFVVFEQSIGGVPYQVIAHLMFSSSPPHSLAGIAALTINLDWVRKSYFGPLLGQVARIGGTQDLLALAVTDETGILLATSGAWPNDTNHDLQRHFPLLFADPVSLKASHTPSIVIRQWAVHVRPGRDTAVDATLNAAYLILALMAVAAAAIAVALVQTVGAVRASARLASMKSDFVSAVTHELKTPLALIRLVAETLGGRRYASPDVITDYAGILSKETERLGQSIDNLLTYARYTEAEHSATLLPRDVADLVEDAIDRFRPTMAELEFELSVNVGRNLPRVAVDGVAITKVIEILTDNAIKMLAGQPRPHHLGVGGPADVTLTFADRGIGIHKDDIKHIFDRFFRGRNAGESGSGLGLAIAQRILTYHGGAIVVRSNIEAGTEFDLRLPIANES